MVLRSRVDWGSGLGSRGVRSREGVSCFLGVVCGVSFKEAVHDNPRPPGPFTAQACLAPGLRGPSSRFL